MVALPATGGMPANGPLWLWSGLGACGGLLGRPPGLGDNLLCRLGPGKRLAPRIPRIDKASDRGDELGDAGEAATSDCLASEDPKEHFHKVHPAGRGWREMQVDPWVLLQPGAHLGMVMGGIVVQHQVQLTPGIGAGDLLTERQELGVAMSIEAAVGDLAGGDLQRGEQRRRTVPDVVVGAALGAARTQ